MECQLNTQIFHSTGDIFYMEVISMMVPSKSQIGDFTQFCPIWCNRQLTKCMLQDLQACKSNISLYNTLQPPVQRELGSDYILTTNGSMKEVKDYCYDVPLIHSLQALLNCTDVKEQVNNNNIVTFHALMITCMYLI